MIAAPSQKQKLADLFGRVAELLEKCGGPGGTPGPCPGGGSGGGGRGKPKKPPKPPSGAKPLSKPGKKPPKDPKKPASPEKVNEKPQGRSAWSKVAKIGLLAFEKAHKKVEGLVDKIKGEIDKEFHISAGVRKVRSFVDKIAGIKDTVKRSVESIKTRIHSHLDGMVAKLQKAAKPKDEEDPESLMNDEMVSLRNNVQIMSTLEETLKILLATVQSGKL